MQGDVDEVGKAFAVREETSAEKENGGESRECASRRTSTDETDGTDGTDGTDDTVDTDELDVTDEASFGEL
jgi:hypothetical protein